MFEPVIFDPDYPGIPGQPTYAALQSRITELECQVAKWKHLESRTIEMEVFASGVCRKLYKLGGLWSVGDDASDSSYEGVLAAFDTINDK